MFVDGGQINCLIYSWFVCIGCNIGLYIVYTPIKQIDITKQTFTPPFSSPLLSVLSSPPLIPLSYNVKTLKKKNPIFGSFISVNSCHLDKQILNK